ncbi:MAG: GntR family transcriptional regulator [Hyphomicrobiales bacterium]|nr:GntR family transcriptional regulator [Hyphomicrobiales bacterium]
MDSRLSGAPLLAIRIEGSLLTTGKTALGRTRTALYLQLAETMRQRMRKGVWREGDFLPSFEQLALEFGVARITVRQAVKLLEEERLLAPRRGLGTMVLPPPKPVRPLLLHSRFADLVDMYRGDRPLVEDLEEGEGDPPGPLDDGHAAQGYHRIRRVHSREGQRYCLISLNIARDVFDRHRERFRNELVLPVLADDPKTDIARVRQTMVISKCDLETAEQIGIPIGDPVAEVRRFIYDSSGRVIYWADVTYRGDFIRLDMELAT